MKAYESWFKNVITILFKSDILFERKLIFLMGSFLLIDPVHCKH